MVLREAGVDLPVEQGRSVIADNENIDRRQVRRHHQPVDAVSQRMMDLEHAADHRKAVSPFRTAQGAAVRAQRCVGDDRGMVLSVSQ